MAFANTTDTYEIQYLSLLAELVEQADHIEPDRTGTGTTRRFGAQIGHDLRRGFPMLTTKKVFWRGVIEELLWFLRGETNITSLREKGVNIWNEWADHNGDLGPVYGAMWRSWPSATGRPGDTVDQIANVIAELWANPESRRLVVSAWNPSVLPDPSMCPADNATMGLQALPPCHTLFQLFAQRLSLAERVSAAHDNGIAMNHTAYHDADLITLLDDHHIPRYHLDCQLYQRSADIFLGVPFNAPSYAAMLTIIAKSANMIPRHFIHTFGDLHLYANHVEQAKTQLSRTIGTPPQLATSSRLDECGLNAITAEDFELLGYKPHSAIKAPVAA